MTTISEFQKDTEAAGDADATVDTNMDVATHEVPNNVISTSGAASASGVEQAPYSLDVSERDEGGSTSDGDTIANEDIEGEGAARTTLQVVVSSIDITPPRHNCCAAPAKTATC